MKIATGCWIATALTLSFVLGYGAAHGYSDESAWVLVFPVMLAAVSLVAEAAARQERSIKR